LAEQYDVPFLGRIPMDASVRVGGDYGRPVAAIDPDSVVGVAFNELAQKIAARISVVMLQNSDVIPLTLIE
jgi:ATP-binding protein involved in chromosome partitioning